MGTPPPPISRVKKPDFYFGPVSGTAKDLTRPPVDATLGFRLRLSRMTRSAYRLQVAVVTSTAFSLWYSMINLSRQAYTSSCAAHLTKPMITGQYPQPFFVPLAAISPVMPGPTTPVCKSVCRWMLGATVRSIVYQHSTTWMTAWLGCGCGHDLAIDCAARNSRFWSRKPAVDRLTAAQKKNPCKIHLAGV